MKLTFGVDKFLRMLLAATFSTVVSIVAKLVSPVLAGNLLGPDALAGVNLVLPVLTLTSFFLVMVQTGTGTRYSLALGRCDVLGARRIFTQALWMVAFIGGLASAAIFFGSDLILALYGASGEALVHARAYLFWLWPLPLLDGVLELLIILGYADGEPRRCVVAYVAVFAVNVLVSSAAIKLGFGLAGCASGMLVGYLVGVAVMALHFRSKSNTYRYVRYFSLKESFAICGASFGDAAAILCDALLLMFINAFTVRMFGSGWLPVVAVALTARQLLTLFDGVAAAAQPIIAVYHGEDNPVSVRKVMNAALAVSLAEGLFATAVFLGFAPLLVRAIGIDDPALAAPAATAIRLLAVGVIAHSLAGLFNSYYMFIERPLLAGVLTFVIYLVAPVAVSVGYSLVSGMNGLWLGLGLGNILGVLLFAALVATIGGRAAFPYLLDRKRERELKVFDLTLDEREIVETSRKIGTLEGVPMKASLLTEEVLMAVKDRAQGKRVLAEVTVDRADGVKLTLRDDGEIFDITDADQSISSLRGYLVASMMIHHEGKLNLVTTGYNRNVFKF